MSRKKTDIEEVEETIIDQEMPDALDERFVKYAYTSLEDRALPDARDGLKPSQRRVLVAMNDLGLSSRSRTVKSAKICGDTSGNYHPHGEAIVYPTMFRLAQDWVMREPLLSGQGNFGNIDGDPPAAMRYTEAKFSKIGELLLEELSKDVVPFIPNYNEELEEPTILPTKFPNLLVNGTEGIAVGWATKIPPHNYREVATAIKAFIKKPTITSSEIIKYMPGPDFPTGGKLLGQDGVIEYYNTGRGSVKLEGNWTIEKSPKGIQSIVVTELPYQSSPGELELEIAELVKNNKIQGITDLKNLSDRNGIRVVIEVAKGGNTNLILNNLLRQTSLRKSFSINQTVLIDGKVSPETNVVKLIKAFVDHRRIVLTNKFTAELNKHLARLHILEALIVVASRIDETIKIIRQAQDDKEATDKLISAGIATSKIQADAILSITLRQLTKLESTKLTDEKKEKEERVAWLKNILSKTSEIDKIIIEEQDDLSKKFGSPRKTAIVSSATDINDEDLVKDEQLVLSVTGDGYVKTTPVETFKIQKRGGVGVNNVDSKRDDNIFEMFETGSKDIVLFFSTKGIVYKKKAYEIPQASRIAKGTHVSNLLDLSEGELITNTISVKSLAEKGYLIIATRKGLIKRTELSEYDTNRSSIIAIKLNDKDQVAFATMSNGNQDVFIVTANGNCVRYNESLVSVQGRSTQGSRALKLDFTDSIAQVFTLDKKDEPDILVVTKGGFGKRTSSDEYRAMGNKSVKGYSTINKASLAKNGVVVGATAITDGDSILVATSKGKVIRMDIADIRSTGRATNGVKVVRMDAGDTVVKLTKLKETEELEMV